jgi:hypothetical protein
LSITGFGGRNIEDIWKFERADLLKSLGSWDNRIGKKETETSEKI